MTTQLTLLPCPSSARCAPQGLKPGHLGIAVPQAKVKVKPVFSDLHFGHLQEQQIRNNTVLGAPGRWFQHHLVRVLTSDAPTQHLRPEPCEPRRLSAVNVGGLDA